MNKFLKAATALIIAIAITAILIVTANAETRYIEKTFTFDGIAPTVIIHHPVYDWVLTAKGDKLTWQKPNGSNSQMFVMFPSEYDGYYRIREFNNGGYEQRYIGYTPSGFKLVWQEDAQAPAIAFKLVWKAKDTVSGKSVKNVWRMPCKANNVCLCVSGWGDARIEQMNAG